MLLIRCLIAWLFLVSSGLAFTDVDEHGLYGRYYSQRSDSNFLLDPYFNAYSFQGFFAARIDSTLDFSWENEPNSPISGLPSDVFSVVWTGEIELPQDDTYQFHTTNDDGVRVKIDWNRDGDFDDLDELLISDWSVNLRDVNSSVPVTRSAGRYPIRVEYYEGLITGLLQLRWSSSQFTEQVIDRTYFYHMQNLLGEASGKGLLGYYFDQKDFVELRTIRLDPMVSFDWSTSPPTTDIYQASFSVRWLGELEIPQDDTYQFILRVDNRARVYLDLNQDGDFDDANELVTDAWSGSILVKRSGPSVFLTQGRYPIKVEYEEDTGNAVVNLRWQSSNIEDQVIPRHYLYSAAPSEPPTEGQGNGLLGHYFSQRLDSGARVNPLWHADAFQGTEILRRDNTVAFEPDNSHDALISGLPRDYFSVYWEGEIEFPYSDTYILYVNSNQGHKLWLDLNKDGDFNDPGENIADEWGTGSDCCYTNAIYIPVGRYPVRLEWYDTNFLASINLRWNSAYIEAQTIPQRYLYSPSYLGVAEGQGLTATYYSHRDLSDSLINSPYDYANAFSGVSVSRIDPTVNFSLYESNPGTYENSLNDTFLDSFSSLFSVRWEGELEIPIADTYSLSTLSDDGVKVWLDINRDGDFDDPGENLIDDWAIQGTYYFPEVNHSTALALDIGRYPIKIEYYQNLAEAVMRLRWSNSQWSNQVIPQHYLYPKQVTLGEGNGTGLLGTYFSQSDTAGNRQSPADYNDAFWGWSATRLDPMLDFDSINDGLMPSFSHKDMSIRWEGKIEMPSDGIYQFFIHHNDGVKFWIDLDLDGNFNNSNELLIDRWEDNTTPRSTESATLSLTLAAGKYPVKLEYFNDILHSTVRLFWDSPDFGLQIIPQVYLYPPDANLPGLALGDGLMATYFDQRSNSYSIWQPQDYNVAFMGASIERIDPQINFDWDDNKLRPAILQGLNDFSVRWQGYLEIPETGPYILRAQVSDGMKLFLDLNKDEDFLDEGEMVMKYWLDDNQDITMSTAPMSLTAGLYPIQIEYYESLGDAEFMLRWEGPSFTDSIIPQAYLYSEKTDQFLQSYSIDVGSGSASTCAPLTVTIRACRDNQATCSVYTDYRGTVQLTTSSGHGNWRLLAGDGVLTQGGSDTGIAQYDFVATDNGEVTLEFENIHADDMYIRATDSNLSISSNSASVSFRDNGFVVSTERLVPVVGRPETVRVEFQRTDGAGNCTAVTDYNGVQDLKVWYEPNASHPSGANPPEINSISLPSSQPTSNNILGVGFINGIAQLALLTTDVGKYALHVLEDSSGFVFDTSSTPRDIVGQSSDFVVRPFGFAIDFANDSNGANALADNVGVPDPSAAAFKKAGQTFVTTIKAVAWQAADDANNDDGVPDDLADLTDNPIIPSFGQEVPPERVDITHTLAAPVDGAVGNLSGGSNISLTSGGAQDVNLSFSEVGIINLTAALTDGNYMASNETVAGVRENIGRFKAHYYGIDGGISVAQGCDAGGFTYFNQSMAINFGLAAYNLANDVVQNYEGDFAQLDLASELNLVAFQAVPYRDLSARLNYNVNGSWLAGRAAVSFASLTLNRETAPDGPFDVIVAMAPNDNDPGDGDLGSTFLSFDVDADNNALNESTQIGTSQFKYGRLLIGAETGSELLNMTVPISLEYYRGDLTNPLFQLHAADTCTSWTSPGDFALTPQPINGANEAGLVAGVGVTNNGIGGVELSAPGEGNTGNVLVRMPAVPDYLQFDLDGNGIIEVPGGDEPTGTAVFGIYKNNSPVLFKRETFR